MSLKTAAVAPWLPWIVGAVGAVLVGGVVGASGIVGHETTEVVEIGRVSVSTTTPAFACPGGAEITTIDRGARVLALSRSDDSRWLAVRDPRAVDSTVWVPARLVTVDDGDNAIADLPLGAPCPAVSLPPLPVEEVAPPAPGPTPTPTPTKPAPAPAPVADTSKPTISSASASPASICTYDNSAPYAWVSTVSVSTADNVGVTGATISWSGAHASGAVAMSGGGGSWSYSYNPPTNAASGTVTFSIQTRDAAGNLSAVATTTVTLDNQCLI